MEKLRKALFFGGIRSLRWNKIIARPVTHGWMDGEGVQLFTVQTAKF